jgi:NAD(P)-dependent dehydrogenase (short-subunit alcohol dehydrogenase family)
MPRSLALVTGGTGAVGSAVLRALAGRGIPTVFGYRSSTDRASVLARELGARPLRFDLRDRAATRAALGGLDQAPDVFIHCAAVSRNASLAALTDEDWDDALQINGRSAFTIGQLLAPSMAAAGGGDIVLVGALDRAQSLPLPVHFAASQGLLSALAMSLAKAVGPGGTKVNMVALGVLDEGLSRSLPEKAIADYKAMSALRRLGTAAEAARFITWLALENRYLSGKVLSSNGGI